MPVYEVKAGYRIDDDTCSRLLAEGISVQVMTQVVRVLNIVKSTNDTIFTIDAGTEQTASDWRNFLKFDLGSIDITELPVVEDPDPPPDALDVWSKVGQWTKSAGGSTTTTIGSLPGTPKGVILFGSGLAGNAHGTWSEAGGMVIGFSNGTTDRVYGCVMQDNVATSNTNRANGKKAFYIVDPTGDSSTHIKDSCTVSFDTDSFDLNWDVNTLGTVGHYFVFGGDDIEDVQIADFLSGTTASVIGNYTGIGDQYDFAMFLQPFTTGSWPTSLTGFDTALHSVSVHAGAPGPTTDFRSWCACIRNGDNVNPSSAHRLQKRLTMFTTMGNISNNRQQEGAWKGFTEDGFKINWSYDPPNTTTDTFTVMLVKGGHWDAGYFYQPTIAGNVRTLLLNKFATVQGMMGLSIGNVDIQYNVTGNGSSKLSVGAQDTDGNIACVSYGGNSSVTPTQEATISVTDKFVKHITAAATASSSSVHAEGAISDMDTPGEFTINYSTADSTTRQVVWFTLSN